MSYNNTTQAIIDRLEENDIEYQLFEHEPVTSSQEAADVREGFSVEQGLKALVLKLYGAEDGFAMIIVPGDTNFNQEKVEKALGADDFRFANESELDHLLGEVEVGGIPPMGSLFNLKTYADERIKNMEEAVFNAGDRRVSIAMSPKDYLYVEEPEETDLIA